MNGISTMKQEKPQPQNYVEMNWRLERYTATNMQNIRSDQTNDPSNQVSRLQQWQQWMV